MSLYGVLKSKGSEIVKSNPVVSLESHNKVLNLTWCVFSVVLTLYVPLKRFCFKRFVGC